MTAALPPPCDETSGRQSGRGACPSERATLTATVLGSSLAFVMGSIVNVALPAMQAGFGTDAAGAQWIINAYLLPLSALVLVAGSLGDHYGRKLCFSAGLVIFTGATLAAALAPSLPILLAARIVQGVGAALIAPNSLAIIADAFAGEKRGKAIGTWAAAGAVAGAAAPPLGGLLIDLASWRWAFGSVIPPALAALIAVRRGVRESLADPGDRSALDYRGAVLATAFLAVTVYLIIALPQLGFSSAPTYGLAAASALLLALFLHAERARGTHAMLPLRVFGSTSFTGITLLTLLLYAALGGLMVLLPYALIDAGYSATGAGAALLPLPLLIALGSRKLGGLATRFGTPRMLALGSVIVAVGFGWFAVAAAPGMAYWTTVFPGLILIGAGMACCVAPLTTAVMDAVEPRFAGIASGINNATSRIAGLIATALLGFVLVGGSDTAGSGDAGESLVAGLRIAAIVAAGLAVLSAVTAQLVIRGLSVETLDDRAASQPGDRHS